MLTIARSLVKKGISVIPVGNDKKPLLASWKEYQTRIATDEELVAWFSGKANIAIVTGKISNLSVVDVDPRHGGTTAGLPPTLVAKTQSGGWHFYYRYLPGLPNRAGVRPGVDIRSDGGFVVCPPSRTTTGAYRWSLIEEPQPFPVDVLQVTTDKPQNDWKKIAQGVTEGGRNEMAAKFIGKLLKTFKQEDWESAVWLTALHWNRSNTPPLDDSELRAVFNSITSRERKEVVNEEDSPVVLMSSAAKLFQSDTTTAYPTGFPVMDNALTGGLRDGNLVVVVGPSGHGKTSFARSMTLNMLKNNITSVWFSFELTIPEMWEKFKESGIEDSARIYTPERYVNKRLDWVKKKLVEARDVYKCKVAYIDHLGFMLSEYKGLNSNDVGRVNSNLATVYSMICRDIKSIAIQENMIVVLMWHVRKTENGKEVEENDIKDSSGVLQECDLAITVQREKATQGSKGFSGRDYDVYTDVTKIKMLKNRRTGNLKKFDVVYQNGTLVDPQLAKAYDEIF